MSRLLAGLLAAGGVLAAAPAAVAQSSVSPTTLAVNEQIAAKWKEGGVTKTARKSTDDEFLRRVFIDLIGRIATPVEVLDFEQDPGADKRVRLVKRLLYSRNYVPKVGGVPVPNRDAKPDEPKVLTFDYAEAFADHWADLWTNWLLTRTGHPQYREQMHAWLRGHLGAARADGSEPKVTPYTEMVTGLLTASGKTNANGAVNFILHHIGEVVPADKRAELGRHDAVPITSRVTRLFLGIQTNCVQCHDHPEHKEWVQADFWGVNAYFRQVTRDRAPSPPPRLNNQMMDALAVVNLSDDPELNAEEVIFYERRDGKLMAAKPNALKDLEQAEKGEAPNKTLSAAAAPAGKTRRQILAEYVVKHDNFAKAYVNRVWGHLFGRGLCKEASLDDFGSHNEVVHPELLARVADDFVKYNYDPKVLLEWVCTSDVYGLSHEAQPASADPKFDPYFARMPLKAMTPEVLFESLWTATKADRAGESAARKKLKDDWMRKLVRNFGDDEGNELTFSGTVIQALLMLNGRELNDEISRKGNNVVLSVVARNSKGEAVAARAVIDQLYLLTLNRHATPAELATLLDFQKGGRRVMGEAAPHAEAVPKPGKAAPPPAASAGGKAAGGKPAGKPNKVIGVLEGVSASDLGFYQDVFWALLNTNEFILNH